VLALLALLVVLLVVLLSLLPLSLSLLPLPLVLEDEHYHRMDESQVQES